MDEEKTTFSIDLFFSIEIKSEQEFYFISGERSVKEWIYVFLLFNVVETR
jgi:hypothetical protein